MNTSPHQPAFRRIPTNQFKRDVRRLQKSKADLSKLQHVIDLLSQDVPLADVYRDHALKGKLNGIRACHIKPDWLLLYRKDRDELVLLLLRTGTHRDTLGIE